MSSGERERAEWARVEAILDEALDTPPDERPALVAGRCGDDHELQARVLRLLAASREGEEYLEDPLHVPSEVIADFSERAAGGEGGRESSVSPESAGPRDDLAPGDRVGAYEVQSLLGRGGMGTVYLAHRADGAFDRNVALKVVKRGMDTDEILKRFHQERSILARLQHPSIATLLDGGVTAAGLPYFAMEVARGDPIDAWCDARQLDVSARLRLFIEVCDAVAYAHRSLVVHRDLKPSNILVLSDGRPKLLDFGIAKLLEDDAASNLTAEVGPRATPDFAAPEQIRGEPTTTATDVYSLGVILYGLLAGTRPHRSGDGDKRLTGLLDDGVFPPPSKVAPGPRGAELRGDLDSIVMKAMRREPDRRYASVRALADDLERYLDGRPVEARPDSAGYRLRKFVRRHGVAVGLGVAAALALCAGTVSTTLMAVAADREREQREVEAEGARAARDFVVDLFAGLDPDQLDGRTTFDRDQLIALGIRNLDDLEDQPRLRAGILNALGQLAFNLGDRDRAEAFFRDSHDLLEGEVESPDLAGSMLGLGEVLRARLRFAEAERWLQGAVEVNTRLLPTSDPRIAESKAALAFVLYNQGPDRFPEAEAIYEELAALTPPPPLSLRARISEGFANLRFGQQRFDEAEVLYRQAVAQRTDVTGRRGSDVARTLWGLGHTLMALDSASAAAGVYGESLNILTRIYGDRHADVAWAHYNLGGALVETGATEQAVESFGAAARLMVELNPPGYLYAVFAWLRLGRAQEELERFPEAVETYRSALAVYDAVASRGREPPAARIAELYTDFARVFAELERPDSVAVYRARAAALRNESVSEAEAAPRR